MDDHEAIKQAALDYIEGWYQGNADRMDRALHPRLAKRRITPEGEVREIDKERMVTATAEGRGCIANPETAQRDVTILDTTGTISSVKVISEEFIDYLHLAKISDQWVIVNVLWEFK